MQMQMMVKRLKEIAYPYQNGQSIESFYKPIKVERDEYFLTLKQSYPDLEEKMRTQARVVKRITN